MTIIKDKYISTLSLILLLLSSFTALSDRIMGRNAFFLSIIFMILVTIKQRIKIKVSVDNRILSLLIILFGFSQGFWYHLYGQGGNNLFLANNNYGIISHYLIAIGVAFFFINNIKPPSINNNIRILVTLFSTIGFIYMCGVGIIYFFNNPSLRIRIDSAATITGYVVTLQCLFTLYLVDVLDGKFKNLLMILIIIIGFITLLLTETRASILAFPILVFLYFFTTKEYARKKLLLSALIFIIAASLAIKFLFPATLERLNSSYTEISEMNTNNDSSLGARVSMWQSGLYAFTQHPFGQSAESRFKEVIYYIDNNEVGNPEAKRNSVYHLHNDLIEALSLQGIVGAIIYTMLIISIGYSAYKKGMLRESLCIFLLPIILFGNVDTLFIDKRFVIVFGAQLLLFEIFQRKNTVTIKTR